MVVLVSELIEMGKRRDLTWHTFFNYCNKGDLVHLDELRDHLNASNETGNILLVKLLAAFEKHLPEEMFLIVRKDLNAVANGAKESSPCDELSKYVTCIPSWEGWSEGERIMLHKAEDYTASHFSFQIINVLLGKEF